MLKKYMNYLWLWLIFSIWLFGWLVLITRAWTYSQPNSVTTGAPLSVTWWNNVVESLVWQKTWTNNIAFKGDNVSIWSQNYYSKVNIWMDDNDYDSRFAHLRLEWLTNWSQLMSLWVNTDDNVGWIQSWYAWNGYRPLLLNPSGWNVWIWNSTPNNLFEIWNIDNHWWYSLAVENSGYGVVINNSASLSSTDWSKASLLIADEDSTSVFRVQNNGNVWIGTSSPDYLLEVAWLADRSGGAQVYINNWDYNYPAVLKIKWWGSGYYQSAVLLTTDEASRWTWIFSENTYSGYESTWFAGNGYGSAQDYYIGYVNNTLAWTWREASDLSNAKLVVHNRWDVSVEWNVLSSNIFYDSFPIPEWSSLKMDLNTNWGNGPINGHFVAHSSQSYMQNASFSFFNNTGTAISNSELSNVTVSVDASNNIIITPTAAGGTWYVSVVGVNVDNIVWTVE